MELLNHGICGSMESRCEMGLGAQGHVQVHPQLGGKLYPAVSCDLLWNTITDNPVGDERVSYLLSCRTLEGYSFWPSCGLVDDYEDVLTSFGRW